MTETQAHNGNGNLPTNEEILAALITKADVEGADKEVRDSLRAYKLDATQKGLENAMKKFHRDTLIKTMLFLNVDGDSLVNMRKPDLVKELICRMQNLLIDNCGQCGLDFATSVEEPLLLKCELCGQNMHNKCLRKILGEKYYEEITSEQVKSLLNPFGLKGFHYMCSSCSKANLLSAVTDEDNQHSATDRNNNVVSTHVSETQTAAEKNSSDQQKEPNATLLWRERDDICSQFLQGTCQHGISGKNCGKFHPHVCNRYRKNGTHKRYGCLLGNACKDFHPAICPNSMKSHTCYNLNCSYKWHLPRTARAAPLIGRFSNNNGRRYGRQWSDIPLTYRNRHNRNSNGYMHSQNFNSTYVPHHSAHRGFYNQGRYSNRGGSREGVEGGEGPSHSQALDIPPNPNNNTNNFSFLEALLQESVAKNINVAFQKLNIADKVQQEMAKLQASKFQSSIQASLTNMLIQ